MTRDELWDAIYTEFEAAADRGIDDAHFAELASHLEAKFRDVVNIIDAMQEDGIIECIDGATYTYRLIEPNRFRR